jgi:2-succinyl-5-enolpyruvyl-6-hydroxy-3-cyclohexene-1-carboxylate synthase
VGALLLPPDETEPRLQVIVGNDGGGTIFDGLEVAQVASREALDRVQLTPQHADISGLASAYCWDYARISSAEGLERALEGGPAVIEVPLPR